MRASGFFEVSATDEHLYVIGLGANLGDRLTTLRAARQHLAELPQGELLARSPVYASAALGPAQPDYLNAAIKLRSPLDAHALLDVLHGLEATFGRTRELRWGPRTLDLDLLWSDTPVCSARLTVPHVGLSDRWWALRPLLDIAPELLGTYGPALAALGTTPAPLHEL